MKTSITNAGGARAETFRPGISPLWTALTLGALLGAGCGASEGATPAPEGEPVEEPEPRAVVQEERAPGDPLDRILVEPPSMEGTADLSKLTERGPEPAVVTEETAGGEKKEHPTLAMVEGEKGGVDFGEVPQGSSGTHLFRLQAGGDVPLVIKRIKPSCGCTVADIRTVSAEGEKVIYEEGRPIQPGTVIEVETEIKTEGRQGRLSSTVTMYTNTEQGFLNLHLSAEIMPVIIVDEGTLVNYGQISAADRVEKTITVRSEVLDPFLLTIDPDLLVEPLTVEASPVDAGEDGRSKVWQVTLTLGPSIPEGVRSYPVRLVTDRPVKQADTSHGHDGHEDHEGHDHAAGEHTVGPAAQTYDLRIFAQAQVAGLVNATPNFLSFGMVRPGQVVERTTRIMCNDDFEMSPSMGVTLEGLHGEEFPHADHLTVELKPAPPEEEGLDLLMRLEGLPDDFNGTFSGLCKVKVGHPLKDELLIRFSGICRPGV